MKNPSAITYALSPITFFFMMPFKVSDFSSTSVEKRIMNSISGFTDIIMGLLAYFFCSVVFRETQTIENSSDVSILVLRCFRLSLGYSLCSWGFFRLAVGSGRWLGYDLSDGSRFALLATSPAEMWKRWSTHLYDWTVGVVFVPMYRRLPIAIAAFTVSFFVLFLLHYSDGLTELFWYSPTGTATTSVTLKGLIYFQSLGLVIYASSIFPNIWPQEQRRSGWL
ncbi:MAG: hypothetical protein JNJ49_06990, partial [Bdellovibrionaceae bacterium]|nr:hypothetical protein [Pseudobdellovibrionaceae bacterium]